MAGTKSQVNVVHRPKNIVARLWNGLYNGQSRVQKVFLFILLSLMPFVYPFLLKFNELYWMRVNESINYDWPSFWDLQTAFTACMMCFVFKFALTNFFTPLTWQMLKEGLTEPEKTQRAQRAALCAFKATYFIASVIFGYFVMRDAPWFPTILGGSGDASLVFEGYPYQNYDAYPLIRGYIMIQLGYHLFSLLTHLASPTRADFLEMLLHHLVTVCLILASYLMNYVAVGGSVLIVHDIADIFIYFSKFWVDTKYTHVALFFYVLLLGVFAFARLYVFPFYLIWYGVWFNTNYYQEVPGFNLLASMLHVLLILHIYWYVLLIKLGYKYATTGKATDMHDKVASKSS